MPHRVLGITLLISGLASGLSAQTTPEEPKGNVNFVGQYIDIESMVCPLSACR